MVSVSFLKKKVEELRKEAEEIQKAGIEVLDAATLDEKILLRPYYSSPNGKMQREAAQRYQRWYTTSFRLVEEFIPEWLDTFIKYYKVSITGQGGANAVMDYLLLDTYSHFTTIEDIISDFVNDFDRQISILLCIPDAVEIKELNLRKLISADVARTEIEQAEILFAGGFHRASGSIAGVALELHLKTLCDINSVAYKPKATIEPLAQALYEAKLLDITELKRVQYLASIRNKCSHPNAVAEAEIQTLIDGVKKLV
jgi:hypothetical protein